MDNQDLDKIADYKKEEKLIRENLLFVNEDLLNQQRQVLFKTVANIKKQSNSFKISSILKYAAVVLLSVSMTSLFMDKDHKNPFQDKLTTPFKNISLQKIYDEGYSITNFNLKNEGEDIIVDFELTTPKTIRGNASDKEMVEMITLLMQNQSDENLKLKNIKTLAKDDKMTDALLTVLKEDSSSIVRQRTLKLLSNKTLDSKFKNILVEIIAKDKDQTLRLLALEVLEEKDREAAIKSAGNLANDKDETMRWRASLVGI